MAEMKKVEKNRINQKADEPIALCQATVSAKTLPLFLGGPGVTPGRMANPTDAVPNSNLVVHF
jgi:hypothetical protein